jgi:hypothetical protein
MSQIEWSISGSESAEGEGQAGRVINDMIGRRAEALHSGSEWGNCCPTNPVMVTMSTDKHRTCEQVV